MNEPAGKSALLQSYDFDIKYRPGKVHTNADGVSRGTYHKEEDQSDNCDELPTFECIYKPVNDTKRRAELTSDVAKELTIVTCAAAETVNEETLILSDDNIRDSQRNDVWYKDIISYLEIETLPDDPKRRRDILTIHNSYVIENGTLFQIYTQDKRKVKNIDINLQICIPKRLVKLLEETHDSLLNGNHCGINRTLFKKRLRYYWPSLNSDVIDWVKSCVMCSQHKRPQTLTKAKLMSMPVPRSTI
ncbi:unnamed protein product [Mytilus coruscus]|uniref:Integrase zinc-binding domain-containing protein n=1 Tax=Mytilus coruscus TaxID=42192 RepID=A0A6J8AC42_MYTCO|nr:unnamed protein product [Mytilus coruscus]